MDGIKIIGRRVPMALIFLNKKRLNPNQNYFL